MFYTLYKWELKKIINRRLTKISVLIIVIITVLIGFGDLLDAGYIPEEGDGLDRYQWMKQWQESSRFISGRTIDDTLLNDMRTAIDTSEQAAKQYESLYSYLWSLYGDDEKVYTADAEHVYQTRMEGIEKWWDLQYLTDGEKEYWKQKEATISPYEWQYAESYITLIADEFAVNLFVLFLFAICLPAVFCDEHMRRTDQLIFSSKFGKQKLYGAKLLAGITFGIGSVVLLYAIIIIITAFLYGFDGFHACMQMVILDCSWTMTVGQAAILFIGLSLLAAILYSILSMLFAQCFKNSVAAMAIMVGPTMLSLFVNVPSKYHLLSRLYHLLPIKAAPDVMLADYQLYNILGKYLTSWQVMLFLYPIIALILAWLGGKVYRRYQVTGR